MKVVAELGSRPTVQAGMLPVGMAAAGFSMIEGARNINNDPQKVEQMSRMAQGILALAGVEGGPDRGPVPENGRIRSWKEVLDAKDVGKILGKQQKKKFELSKT
ncbi:MAG TPA: hypothetical protein EYP78_00740 [Candidatus Omnitrophica bacterium]|nr:hypothetical protein [Candidatus Omnitrophota bacterium]